MYIICVEPTTSNFNERLVRTYKRLFGNIKQANTYLLI